MIIKDDSAVARLNSPLNLINQLKNLSNDRKKKDAMSLFGINRSPAAAAQISGLKPRPIEQVIEKEEAKLDDILQDSEAKINLGLAHDSALKLLNASLTLLSDKLPEVSASKLPSVIAAASKTVESIRKERNEAAKNNKDQEVHYHFYTPQQNKLENYEVIDVQ